MSGAIGELLASSRAGATHVETGRFRLDWKKALDKIREFQLVDPHRWVLEIVMAAVSGGASAIAVTTDSDDVVVEFDGATPDPESLENLFEHLFARDAALRPMRHLALGVNAALALRPKFIRIDAGDGATGHRLELSSYEDFERRPLAGDVPRGVRVHVRERTTWRRIARAIRSRTPEGGILAACCRFSPVPVTLDGQRVDRDFAADSTICHHFEDGPMRGTLVLRDQPRDAGVVVCMYGVRVVEHRFEADDPAADLGLEALVYHDELTRNASHTDFFRNERWHAMLVRVRAEMETLVDVLCEAILEGPALIARDRLLAAARLILARRPAELTPAQEALLGMLDVVGLATSYPTTTHLLQLWQDVRRRGRLACATRVFDVSLDELSDGLIPVILAHCPPWLQQVFAVPTDNMDSRLGRLQTGTRNQMQRRGLRRDPELWPEEAFVQVPVRDEANDIRGEVGLDERLAKSLAALASGKVDPLRAHGIFVVYCRGRVPLGGRWIPADVHRGVAVVECPRFQPVDDWTDVVTSDHTRAADQLVAAAVPALAEALRVEFPAPPPPTALLECGSWTRDGGFDSLPPAALADARADALGAAARVHIDSILHARRFDREQWPAIWSWKLFHLVDGTAVSLDQVAGHEPISGATTASQDWRVALGAPWGGGGPAGLRIVNATPQQREILKRHLGRSFLDGAPALHRERTALSEAAAAVRRSARNLARARQRRQPPTLAADGYAAVVDLDVPRGRGQAGLKLGNGDGRVRVLVDGMPLADIPLEAPFQVHAVVTSELLKANLAFDGLADAGLEQKVTGWVRAAYPKLVAALAASPAVAGPDGEALVWAWLDSLATGLLGDIPEGVLDLALVPVVGGARTTLRALRDDVRANGHAFRRVRLDPGRAVPGRPIVVCDAHRCAILVRVLRGRAVEYGKQLERELAILDRRQAAPEPARLDVPVLLRVPIEADGYDGELALTGRVPFGRVRILLRGVFIQQRPIDIDGMPLVGVISSDRFEPNPTWETVLDNVAWNDAERALRVAADRLITEGCRVAAEPTPTGAALRAILRALCGRRFAARPEGPLQPDGEVEAALAAAPLWEVAGADARRVTLAAIAEQARAIGSVWLVGDAPGHPPEGRVVVRHAAGTAKALAGIWGKLVRDGAAILAPDDAAAAHDFALPEGSSPIDAARSPEESPARTTRRNEASTARRLPPGCIAEADVRAGDLHGRLALGSDAKPGKVAIFRGGHQVEDRILPDMPGLCGWLDGPLAAGADFGLAERHASQRADLERLYDERLAAAVDLAYAHGRRRGSTWRALVRYVLAYLFRHHGELGDSFRQRRDRALAPSGKQSTSLRRALVCPVFETDRGWVPLPALLTADPPRIVVSNESMSGLPEDVVLVRGSADELVPLLTGVVGFGGITDAAGAREGMPEWRADAGRRDAARQREQEETRDDRGRADARRREAIERRRKRRTARDRSRSRAVPWAGAAREEALAALRAQLREIAHGSGTLPQSAIRDLELPAGRFWEDAIRAHRDGLPDTVTFMAVAYVSGRLDAEPALELLGRLARWRRSSSPADPPSLQPPSLDPPA